MRYQTPPKIEKRLETVLKPIRRGRFSTRGLAEEVSISIPTISRCVQALSERGHQIRSESGEGGWRYVLGQPKTSPPLKKRIDQWL